jgi:hypothetical protein
MDAPKNSEVRGLSTVRGVRDFVGTRSLNPIAGNTMTDKQTQEQAPKGNMLKDPDQWTTGEEPMTGAQRSYLKTLSEEAGEPFDEHLTKAQASKRIEELQQKTGRGVD